MQSKRFKAQFKDMSGWTEKSTQSNENLFGFIRGHFGSVEFNILVEGEEETLLLTLNGRQLAEVRFHPEHGIGLKAVDNRRFRKWVKNYNKFEKEEGAE